MPTSCPGSDHGAAGAAAGAAGAAGGRGGPEGETQGLREKVQELADLGLAMREAQEVLESLCERAEQQTEADSFAARDGADSPAVKAKEPLPWGPPLSESSSPRSSVMTATTGSELARLAAVALAALAALEMPAAGHAPAPVAAEAPAAEAAATGAPPHGSPHGSPPAAPTGLARAAAARRTSPPRVAWGVTDVFGASPAPPRGLDAPYARWSLRRDRFITATPSWMHERAPDRTRSMPPVERGAAEFVAKSASDLEGSCPVRAATERPGRTKGRAITAYHVWGQHASLSTELGSAVGVCIPPLPPLHLVEAQEEKADLAEEASNTGDDDEVVLSSAVVASNAVEATGDAARSAACAAGASGSSGFEPPVAAQSVLAPRQQHSSLDAGFYKTASLVTTTSSLPTVFAGRPRSSMSVFGLQRQVVHSHSETPQSRSEGAENGAPEYIGIPSLKPLFQADLGWSAARAHFWWLGLWLKAVGVVCAATPFAHPGPLATLARVRHLVALAYLACWHLGLWFAVALHAHGVIDGFARGVRAQSLYADFVQGLVFLASALAHAANARFFAGNAFAGFAAYAARSLFIQCWSAASWISACALVSLLAALGAGTTLLAGGGWLHAVGVMMMWLPFIVQYHIFLATLQFCSLGLDAFALQLLHTAGLAGLVGRFDKLHAAMRRGAYAMQAGLTTFATVLFVAFFATVYRLVFSPVLGGSPAEHATSGVARTALWVAVLAVLGLHLLNTIARVNAKCCRLPALIQSLNFGLEIDHDKWCVAAHIASLEAGFFVHNVPVTRWSVLKFGYFALAATSFLLTRLVFAEV